MKAADVTDPLDVVFAAPGCASAQVAHKQRLWIGLDRRRNGLTYCGPEDEILALRPDPASRLCKHS